MISTGSINRRRGSRDGRVRASSATRGRLRLVVVQALVLTLFVTLFARLWAMSPYQMPPNRAGHSVYHRNPSPAPAWVCSAATRT